MLNSAINYANAGYYDLALMDAAFAFAPLGINLGPPKAGNLGPRPQTLNAAEARAWYNNEIITLRMIVAEMRSGGQMTLEAIATFASNYRNGLKIKARALMEDQATAQNLPPIRSTEYYIQKYKSQGHSGDAAYEKVIEGFLTCKFHKFLGTDVRGMVFSAQSAAPFRFWEM